MSKWIPAVIFVVVAAPIAMEGWRSYDVSLRDEYEEQVVGVAAPDFEGTTTTGVAWRLSEARGEVLLMNAWRSACEACLDTLPTMKSLRSEFAGSGIQLVGVSFDQSRPALEAFLQQVEIDYPVIHDEAGIVASLYGMPFARPEWMAWAASVPQTYLIDRNGSIAGAWSGPILPGSKRESEVRHAIRRLLGTSRA